MIFQLIPAAFSIGVSALGLLLLFSAIEKLRAGVGSFARTLTSTYGIPGPLARPAALIVPIAEMSLGFLMFLPPTRSVALITAAAFFMAMAFIAGLALARGLSGACGCFGELIESDLGPGTWIRALTLAGIAALLAFVSLFGEGPVFHLESAGPADGLAAVAALVLVVLMLRGSWRLVRAAGGA